MSMRLSFDHKQTVGDSSHPGRPKETNPDVSSPACIPTHEAIYKPSRLATRKIMLSDTTLGEVSHLEMLASRCDCLIGSSPFQPALAQIMARMEGVFEAILNGKPADYRLCCYLDFLEGSEPLFNAHIPSRSKLDALELGDYSQKILNASFCAHQMEAIETSLLFNSSPLVLTPGYVLALHQIISSTLHPSAPSGLRYLEYPSDKHPPMLYQPPSPMDLPDYLSDLVGFVNESKLGPTVKSALVHHQIEATKMFSSCIEQVSRAMIIIIWRNAGLIRHLMPPLTITPVRAGRQRDKILRPYQFSRGVFEAQMIDEWVHHTATASQHAFNIERRGYQLAAQLAGKWKCALSRAGCRVSEPTQRILVSMIGAPVFSTSSIAKQAQTSFSTASKIISSIERCGIAVQRTRGQRNKVYECPEAISLFDRLTTTPL